MTHIQNEIHFPSLNSKSTVPKLFKAEEIIFFSKKL